MMELQRLPIVRMDDEVLARDGKTVFDIINPKDIPEGVEDGIFQLDRERGTAKFESRHEKPPYIRVPWKHVKPLTRSHTTPMPDGTVVHRLCDGHVILTIKPGDKEGTATGYAEGIEMEGMDDLLRYTLVMALAGVDVAGERFTEALESLILFMGSKKS